MIPRKVIIAVLVVSFVFFMTGCPELFETPTTTITISGTVTLSSSVPTGGLVWVGLLRTTPIGSAPSNVQTWFKYQQLPTLSPGGSTSYSFSDVKPDRYIVGAFCDVNANSMFDQGEPAGAYPAPNGSVLYDFVGDFNQATITLTAATGDTTPPTVASTSPANAATNVAINSPVTATFSEAMNAATITATSFTLRQGSTPVTGTVSYSGQTATFTPGASLAISTVFTATITTSVQDVAGNPMAAAYTWSFTTGAAADTTPPTVTATSPADAATNVSVSSTVTATFSEAMSAATITATSFTVKQGTTPVAGTVSYAGLTATFTPTAALANSTAYTATITTSAQDLAGNGLASAHTWSFTTGAAADTTPPMITATSPADAATNMSINSTLTATFSEAMNSLTITTTSFTVKQGATPVAGAVSYSGLTATFTPTAALASSTAYTAMITTSAQDLAGNPMATSYTWSFTTGSAADTTPPTVTATSPADAAINIAVSSPITATFSEAMSAATITTTSFTLKQGTAPVAGTVSYSGVTATFTPAAALANSTAYTATITTGAQDLAGNPMATSHTWSFTTVPPADTTPPTVASTSPLNGAASVAVTSAIVAGFSEQMDAVTVTTASFTLSPSVAGNVTYNSGTKAATFTPTVSLAYSTTYTATITTSVKDLAGNPMAAAHTWTFTTAAAPDTTPPTVLSTIPVSGAINVGVNAGITATFSESMDSATITSASFTLSPAFGANVTYDNLTKTATFNPAPSGGLLYSTTYTATISVAVKDAAGNHLATPYTWSFTTAAAPDTTPPTVSSTNPPNGFTNLWIGSTVSATFSEAMDQATITSVNFSIPGAPGTVSYNAGTKTATFTPAAAFANSTTYTATIWTGVTDLAGNHLASSYSWSFTTEPAADTTPPVPGGGGTLSYSNALHPTVRISWTKATDDQTPQSGILYKVVYSTTNSLNTVNDCWMAAAITGFVADISSADATNLTAGTRYYFNVIARDAANNMSIYTSSCGPDVVVKRNGTVIPLGGTDNLGSVNFVQTFMYTIENTGDQTLHLPLSRAPNFIYHSTTDSPSGWSITSQPDSDAIAPGTTKTFILQLNASINPYGQRNAALYVESDDPTLWNYWFNVTAYANC